MPHDLGHAANRFRVGLRMNDSFMHTFTGKHFYPLDPDVNDIDIRDIAHSLSLICRFGGHVPQHYSVAQHSVLVSLVCNPEDAAWGLLHDAAECYVGDMVGPLKHRPGMEDYRHAENVLQQAIAVRFGLPVVMPGSVHWADRQVLATEQRDLFQRTDPEPTPLEERIFPWSAAEAKNSFLRRASALGIK